MHVTADPIFLLDATDEGPGKKALEQAGLKGDLPLIGISVRSLRTGPDFISQMAAAADRITELGYQTIFLPMHMPYDAVLSRQIIEQMTAPGYLLDANLSPETLIGACRQMDLVIAMRLHTMLFAACANVPVIGLVCDPKIAYFLEKLDMPSAGAVEDFQGEALMALIQSVLEERAAYQERLAHALPQMREGAKKNTELLGDMLG